MPEPPKETLPHPKGVDVETLRGLIRKNEDLSLKEFLVENFHRVGERTAEKFLKSYGLDPFQLVGELSEEELLNLSRAMNEYSGFLPPKADVLSPIGEENFLKGIQKEFSPEYVDVVSRPPSSYAGHPFIVEAGLAYGGGVEGEPGEIKIYRFANKIPLLYDEGSDVTAKVVESVDWNYYKKPTRAPLALFFHICSTKVPFRSLGKEFIADVPEVEREIKGALRTLLRRFSTYLRREEATRKRARRAELVSKYLDKIAEFSARILGKPKPDIGPLVRSL